MLYKRIVIAHCEEREKKLVGVSCFVVFAVGSDGCRLSLVRSTWKYVITHHHRKIVADMRQTHQQQH
jgi:hypothetical protein